MTSRRDFLSAGGCTLFAPLLGKKQPPPEPVEPVHTTAVMVADYGDVYIDAGAAVMAAWEATKDIGATLILPSGELPVLTPIIIDTADLRGRSFRLEGSGTPHASGSYPWFDDYKKATVLLNGAALSVPAIQTISSQGHRAAIRLAHFAVAGAGIKIENAGASSTFDNLFVTNAPGIGFEFVNLYGGNIGSLYGFACGVAGFKFSGCNANNIGLLISRENKGLYAIEWEKGYANSIGHLYLEANAGGALRWYGDVRSLVIGSVYLEANNSGSLVDYELRLGDRNLSLSTARNCIIQSIACNAPANGFLSRIGAEHCNALQIGVDCTAHETVFAFVDGTQYANTPIMFQSCVLDNATIDLSQASGESKVVGFANCRGTNFTLVIPPNGGGRVESFASDRAFDVAP